MPETKTCDHAQEGRPRSRRREARPPRSPEGRAEPREALNLAVVRGIVSSPPEVRVLPSDTVLVQLQVTHPSRVTRRCRCRCRAGTPTAWVEDLEPGDEIVVVGRVRRRFFRAGGATASRVELEADVVARAADRAPVRVAVRRACGRARGARRVIRRVVPSGAEPPNTEFRGGGGTVAASGPIGGQARRGDDHGARRRSSTNRPSNAQKPEKAEVNGDRRGEPDSSGGNTRPRRHSLRRRLRRRHAARRRPLHGAVGGVRQRPGDAAQLPGRDPSAGGHDRRRVVVPGAHLRPRDLDARRLAERARRDEPGRAQGEPPRHDRRARRCSSMSTRSTPATSTRPATSRTRCATTRSPRSACTRCR